MFLFTHLLVWYEAKATRTYFCATVRFNSCSLEGLRKLVAAASQLILPWWNMLSGSSFYILDLKSLAVHTGFPFEKMVVYSTFRLLIYILLYSDIFKSFHLTWCNITPKSCKYSQPTERSNVWTTDCETLCVCVICLQEFTKFLTHNR